MIRIGIHSFESYCDADSGKSLHLFSLGFSWIWLFLRFLCDCWCSIVFLGIFHCFSAFGVPWPSVVFHDVSQSSLVSLCVLDPFIPNYSPFTSPDRFGSHVKAQLCKLGLVNPSLFKIKVVLSNMLQQKIHFNCQTKSNICWQLLSPIPSFLVISSAKKQEYMNGSRLQSVSDEGRGH